MEHLTKEEATKFFAQFYNGEHHIPGYEPKPTGFGWFVNHDRGSLATYDFNELTRFVVMAHDQCIRVEINGVSKNVLRISIWKRGREGGMSERHIDLETAITQIRENLIKNKT